MTVTNQTFLDSQAYIDEALLFVGGAAAVVIGIKVGKVALGLISSWLNRAK